MPDGGIGLRAVSPIRLQPSSRFPDPDPDLDLDLDLDLEQLCGTFIDCGARFVVIGGFAVIANRHVRATDYKDIGVMIPAENQHAMTADLGSGKFRIAGLRSIVAMKRLADRPRDRNDLAELELANGELPRDPIPGLDT